MRDISEKLSWLYWFGGNTLTPHFMKEDFKLSLLDGTSLEIIESFCPRLCRPSTKVSVFQVMEDRGTYPVQSELVRQACLFDQLQQVPFGGSLRLLGSRRIDC